MEATRAAESERARPSRHLALGILLLALVVRLGAVVADSTYEPENDALHFDMIATSLASGSGYGDAVLLGTDGPSAYRAPLYPVTLAFVYAVFGDHSWTAGRVANALVGTLLVAAIGLVALQLWGRRVGLVALAIAAVHPTLVLFGSGLQLEPLLATLLLAALACALEHRRRPVGIRWALAAGVAIGLAVLTRETALVMVPVLVWLVWQPRTEQRSWRTPAVLVAVAAAVVIPWTIRNAVALDAFVPVTTSGGYTLAGTYNQTSKDDPDNPGVWIPPERDPAMAKVVLALDDPDEVDLDQTLRRQAIKFALDDPAYVGTVAFWNAVRLFDLQGPGHALFYAQFLPYPSGLTRASVYASWLLGLAALVGLATRRVRRAAGAVLAFPLMVTVVLCLVSGEIRYRASIEPFTVMLAAAGIVATFDRLRPLGGPST
jgi:4-amino-4-deoxy-L-arabinose transferase-like glycosyltransferase